jgi:transcriptional regulator with XRE-family HTH domain
MTMLTISDQIRVQIRESGLSQREIAARSGVSLSIITYFLSGKSITTGNLDRIFAVVSPKAKKVSRT